MAKWVFLWLGFLGIAVPGLSQQNEELDIKDESPIVQAGDRFKPRPKVIVLDYEVLSDIRTNSSSEIFGGSQATISQNLLRKAKINFPIILKEKLNVIGGLSYSHEQFLFDDIRNTNYPLYQRFEDKPLKKIGFKTIVKKSKSEKKFVFFYLNTSLNSDVPQFRNIIDQLKLSVSAILGKNANPDKQLGYGISFGYDFGQPTVFPLLIYKNDFSLHWGLELLLPKSVKIRYSPTNGFHIFGYMEIDGASYHIQGQLFEDFDRLEFRRSALRPGITMEKEIHDWLWVGISAGWNYPLNIFFSEPQKRRRDSILDIDADATPFLNASVFLVPPRKLFKKAKGR